MQINNLTNPGVQPVDGDQIEIIYDNGSIERKQYTAPGTPVVPVPAVDPCEWLVDLGPFYDRFGGAKMGVLTSTDGALKAILQDVNIRKWVDLQRPDVAQALAYVGSVVAAVTPAMQASILTTPVTAEENRALRKLYF